MRIVCGLKIIIKDVLNLDCLADARLVTFIKSPPLCQVLRLYNGRLILAFARRRPLVLVLVLDLIKCSMEAWLSTRARSLISLALQASPLLPWYRRN